MFFQSNLKYLTSNILNQNQLALKLGVTRQTITTWLKTNDPRASTLIKIANVYNISIDDLLLKDLTSDKTE